MGASAETIYTYVYLLGRGSLKKELIQYLRQRKKTRYRRACVYDKRGKIPEMISIDERPAQVADRSLAGHWEGDLIIGKRHKSAIGTIVERKTRAVILGAVTKQGCGECAKGFLNVSYDAYRVK